jgi:hypothetical protein
MSKLLQRISTLTVLILGIISVVLVALIYFGGNSDPIIVGEDSLAVPKFTDALLYWTYFLIVLTIGITLLLTIIGFVKKLIDNPASALKTLIPFALFALIFVVSWLLGSSEKIDIIGYEGTDNVGYWAKFSDMMIFSIYALFVAIAVTIIGSGIYKSLK